MFINKICNTNKFYHPVAFRSNTGDYKAENGNPIGTFTNMFRSDLDWENFTDFINNHFKDKSKVNFLEFGASDGSEAYTQIISLLESGQDCEKFFPIKAYDINPEICNAAKSGLINMSSSDIVKIYSRNIDFDKYFADTNINLHIKNDTLLNCRNSDTYKALPHLTTRVKFQNANMYDVLYEHKDNSNSIVMCRNVLYYLSDREIDFFTTLAASILKKGSIFVTGEIDPQIVDRCLQSKGFQQIMPYVYIKE